MSLIPEPAARPTRRSRVIFALAAFALLYLLTIALAPLAAADSVVAAGDAPQLSFTFSWVLFLQLATSVLIPVVVGIITTKATHAGTKSILLAGLALVSSLLLEILNAAQTGTAYDVGQGLFLFLPTFVIAVATHYGFWKPTGTSDAVQRIGTGRHAA
ncbi:hypothetical protein [Pseudoclavibacter sp. VKM Ac-2888]|uniref:hypothetical protein n=1 Tax=Pseudoclavibacter sp. VKM Ac-2888 TaxID=2783830 RepID=UPI00188AE70D|nr:hypothetical protein [Pseudoclavibacter sp. VKM Ac-2888]MBF4549655.1 hypothetical protein [Pseudoclavibacter sp. VKM Ac-2888]